MARYELAPNVGPSVVYPSSVVRHVVISRKLSKIIPRSQGRYTPWRHLPRRLPPRENPHGGNPGVSVRVRPPPCGSDRVRSTG